jgi:hypothetical protein
MRGWHVVLAHRDAVDVGRPGAGGSWPGGQASPPTSQPIPSVDRSQITTRPMGLPRPPGSPIALPAMGWWHTLPAATARLCADPGVLLERIPSPLTLGGDLGKRRSAQR